MRKTHVLLPLLVLLLAFLTTGNASMSASTHQRQLEGIDTSKEETILNEKPVGPYSLTIQGSRIIGRAYLALSVQAQGKPVPPDTTVQVNIAPTESKQGGKAAQYVAPYRDGKFVVDAPAFTTPESWIITTTIKGNQGEATTSFITRIYPPNPGLPGWVDILSVAAPIILAGLLLLLYRVLDIPLLKQRRSLQSAFEMGEEQH